MIKRSLPEGVDFSAVREVFKDTKKDLEKGNYVSFIDKVDKDCSHETCSCHLLVEGRAAATLGYTDMIYWRDLETNVKLWSARFSSKFTIRDGELVGAENESAVDLAVRIFGTNLRCVDPPINHKSYPPDPMVIYPSSMCHAVAKRADILLQRRRYKINFKAEQLENIYKKPKTLESSEVMEQWKQTLRPWEKQIIDRDESMYMLAFGTTNGYPHFTHRATGLYPTKAVTAIMNNCRGTDKPPEAFQSIEKHLTHALDYQYYALRTRQYWGKLNLPCSIAGSQERNLHASSGLNMGPESTVEVSEGVTLRISPNAKKYETNTADIAQMLAFIEDEDADPVVFWENNFKNETGTHPKKKWTPETWAANEQKIRTFVNPSSLFGQIELVVGERMTLERGSVIRVGMPWKHGGMDWLAKCMGLKSLKSMMKKKIVEGDATNFDQSVWSRLVDLYMSFGLVYDDKELNPDDYAVRVRLTRWLIKNLIVRIMHAFGPIWVEQRGGVPSGCQNTSHMDSWVMSLWLFMFWMTQAAKASFEMRERILKQVVNGEICFVVYGDDHFYNMGDDEDIHEYLNGNNFKAHMKLYFNVEIRDMKESTTFLSFQEGGKLIHIGGCFLKHYAVVNPYKSTYPDQPLTLPFRETSEYVVKALVGRENLKARTTFDILLSSMGHAYNTYASNFDAYEKLYCIYTACMDILDFRTNDQIMEYFLKNYPQEIKTYNKMGITVDELAKGFPTWECLIKQNTVKLDYHLTRLMEKSWTEKFSTDC